MQRFLSSININEFDDFDIEFEMIARNRFDKNQWDMIILKQTPWDYCLLRKFQDALNNIKYKYTLRFSYLKRPDSNNVVALFDEWYQTLYHVPSNYHLKINKEDYLYFEFPTEDDKNSFHFVVEDFKDFLNFINYEFVISETIKPIEVKPEISATEMQEILKNAENDAIDSMENIDEIGQINDRNDVLEILEEERKEMSIQVQNSLLDMMKENAEQMRKERERARLNRRGNYQPVENIDSITAASGSIDFNGKVFSLEKKEFGGKVRLTIGVNDSLGGAIYVSAYQGGQLSAEVVENLIRGTNVRIRGVSYNDEFTKQIMIKGHYVDLLPPDEIVPDEQEQTRVELHLHSNMSAMDAVTNMMDYCKYAKALGHKAIGITDHAVVQGYPDAQKAAKKTGLKMLYGVEFYMVDSQQIYVKNPANIPLTKAKYVVLDLETTGLSCKYNKIIEFGAVKVEGGTITSSIDILINPEEKLSQKIIDITDITDDLLEDKPTIDKVIDKIVDFCGDAILVTHNAEFDISFLQENLKKLGKPLLTNPIIDTLALSRYLFPNSRRHNLGSLCRNMDVVYDEESAHRADYDATVLNEVWQPMIVQLTKNNHNLTHADLEKLETPVELLKHIKPNHIIAYAKNKAGLKAIYKLVSLSHVEYLADVPKIPREEIIKYRENLILGSACFNGEVFNTARYYNEDVLKEVISFYDYIEIQPKENYSYLLDMGDLTESELDILLKDIVHYADEVGKPVCATGDVHYLTKEEKKFRDVYIFAKGLGGTLHPLNPYARSSRPAFENPDQHYRSTTEMLECMSFLGEEKAKEIVITNTNKIADQIEQLIPVPNDHLYTPKIENCENLLRDMCFENAKKLYGDPLPEFIDKRLTTELNGIINNGYSVIYYMAHKIIKKANDDGYIVGSRGSVGSSFAATMAGVTEVNPLPPHYICPHCHHLEWTSESMPSYKSGYDLPEKVCPVCGKPMIHDGQNIPFETFLGFNADKTPDIDLNFPGDYQANAHNYTKELLGEEYVYRAGTIETVADKTAFGYARGFVERSGLNPDTYPKAKIAYLASGCIDVKRTTGQHPGGIVVVPTDYDVYDFTPIQYPADEPDSAWKTTHFDFHSIHDTILKFDLLGHVDPMALRMMCQLTNVKMEDIPMNDPKVLSLFSSPAALEMKSDYLGNKTGALGIPEFGTENSRRILELTSPKLFSDLVIISGLSHGTDVWSGNAEKLIQDGVATLQEVIGCRDDIMTYLIDKGIPAQTSFSIMEDVRHGYGLKESFVDIMKANNVPQFYIDSCNKIKYMFPKGHAVAYVTMAIRVGYFKIYYPLEFYATFFSVRSKQYDIKSMIAGKEAVINKLDELKLKNRSRTEKLSPKEAEQLKTLNIALEMLQRGYTFANLDIYKSDPVNFVVDHENKCLIPPLITLDGLGENNAITVKEEREKNGKFLSIEDLLRRTKLTSTNVADLKEIGALKDLNESDQLSLFDF